MSCIVDQIAGWSEAPSVGLGGGHGVGCPTVEHIELGARVGEGIFGDSCMASSLRKPLWKKTPIWKPISLSHDPVACLRVKAEVLLGLSGASAVDKPSGLVFMSVLMVLFGGRFSNPFENFLLVGIKTQAQ